MNRTTNLELKKPEYSDYADIEDINDNMDVIDATVGAVPSGSTLQGQITSLQTGKADKVSSATNGNFAGLDSNGNLVDSGHKHSDYVITVTQISGSKYRINL